MDTSGVNVDAHQFSLDTQGGAALARLRVWVRQMLPELAHDVRADVELVCTELATNAIEHASGPRKVRLWHRPDIQTVRVEVDDSSPQLPPHLGWSRCGPQRRRGRGLILVAALARWGTRLHCNRKTVWADVSTASRRAPAKPQPSPSG